MQYKPFKPQVKAVYQHAVKEGIVDLGFAIPSKAAQLAAHHVDQVKVVHPVPLQACVNLDRACRNCGRVVTGIQVQPPISSFCCFDESRYCSIFAVLCC